MKRIFTISGLALLCLFLVNTAFAQNVTLRGKVTDGATGESLIGVSVVVKGTQQGAQTDVNGAFTLQAPAGSTLVISYIGYTTQQVAAGSGPISIKLLQSSNELNQVVVVGYGTQKKVDVTGSIATVSGADISKQASTNPISALQGKVAGLNVVNTGAPGSTPHISIRGVGTIYGGTGVLYVVDGAFYDDIAFLNPDDVESVSVLKDGSSTAIYGIRAANGVILITTKRGKKGTAVVNYNAYAGYDHVTNQVQMADATEYATAINELQTLNGAAPLFANPSSFGKGTDWYGQILRDAFRMNHDLSVRGGTEKSDYDFSVSFLDQDGIVRDNNYKRITVHFSDNYQPYKILKFGISLNTVYDKARNIDGGIFHELFGAGPVVPVRYADGTYGDPSDFNLGGGNNYNPEVTLDYYDNHSAGYRLTGNGYAQLTIARNFTFKSTFGGDFIEDEGLSFTPLYKATLSQQSTQTTLSRTRNETRNWLQENTLTYDNTFAKDHHVTVLAGISWEQRQGYSLTMSAQGVPDDGSYTNYFNLGSSGNGTVTDAGSLRTFESQFARVNYAYKDKYLLNASIRRDGASSFVDPGKNNGYETMPAIGLGWVISSEDFMKDQTVFSLLKLRGGYGEVANNNVPYVVAEPVATSGYFNVRNGSDPGSVVNGSNVSTVTPPFIVAEKAQNTDIGLETGFLNNALSVEIDYYNRLTKNAVFDILVPSNLGTTGNPLGNQANIRNRGFEIQANWKGNIGKDFTYSLSGNFSTNQNKVTKVLSGKNPLYGGGNGITNGALATITQLGQPVGEFYGYRVAGIFQNTAQVAGSSQKGTAVPGDFEYVDENHDGQIDGRDRVALGNAVPKYNYGFNTTFSYKNIDFTADFQGVAGVSIYNANIAYRFGNENFTQDFYDHRWHGEGTSNTYPSVKVGSNTNAAPNSFFVESGAYFRIRNLQVGYSIPSAVMSKIGIQRLRIFADAQNPFDFFSYKGFNPEVGGDSPTDYGIDANVYPLYATYRLGVQVTF